MSNLRSKDGSDASAIALRQRAESSLSGAQALASARALDAHDRLSHELDVHRVELELQADELRRAQAELESSLDRYRDLYDFAPVGYLTIDAHGHVQQANLAAARLLGSPRSELLRRSFARFVSEDSLRAFELHRRIAEQTRNDVCEVTLVRADGARVEVQIESAPIAGPEAGCRTVLTDLTHLKEARRRVAEHGAMLERSNLELRAEIARREQIQSELRERDVRREAAEQALRHERDFSDRLIAATPAIVLALGIDGRVLRFNEYLQQLGDYAINEVIDEDWVTAFVAESGRDAAREAFASVFARPGTRSHQGQLATRSGELRDIEWHMTSLPSEDGTVNGVVCIGLDVTDKKRVDEQLRQAQKMEALGTLVSGVAHDFNNVLTGIIGCADLVSSRLGPTSPLLLRMAQLRALAVSGTDVIERLMTFARKEPSASVVVDLNAVVSGMDALLAPLLGEDLKLQVSCSAEHAGVWGNRSELERIVMNLCVNARQAMPRGGVLALVTRETDVSSGEVKVRGDLAPGRYVVLEVNDTGVGMNAATRARIFEPFFTTKTLGKGTGLGLATVYAVVSQLRGHIEVRSEPGLGTQFTVYFPQSNERPSQLPSLASEITRELRGSETVLVVEDETLVRLAVVHYLGRHGYRVLEAANGQEALRCLDTHPGQIDLLLTDVVLPGSSGPEVAASVLSARPDMRVAFMSAHPSELLVAEGRLASGVPTIQKPFTEFALLSRVREVLGASQLEASDSWLRPTNPVNSMASAPSRPRVLLIEDDAVGSEVMSELLTDAGCDITLVKNGSDALSLVAGQQPRFDLLISDFGLPDIAGSTLVEQLRVLASDTPVLIVSGRSRHDAELSRVLAAHDVLFMHKPIDADALLKEIGEALRKQPSAAAGSGE